MVSLKNNCVPFCDYGVTKEIYIDKDIYDDFVGVFGGTMTLAVMSGYSWTYYVSPPQHTTHSIRLSKDGSKVFTIHIYNNVDRYHNDFSLSIFYHNHHNFSLHKELQYKFDSMYDEQYRREDNGIFLETEKQIVDGFKKFQTII
jgi:hypothetical protein